MSHWTQPYIGRTYQEGAFDCADLARLVNREVFKREIRLPAGRDYAGKAGAAKLRAMKKDHRPLLLKTNLDAGHFGASGRYEYLKEIAFNYVFLLAVLSVEGTLGPTPLS